MFVVRVNRVQRSVNVFMSDFRANSWRQLLTRILDYLLPSAHPNDRSVDPSWSTVRPSETLALTSSDDIEPWWDRRDATDHTPATYLFVNEPLTICCSMPRSMRSERSCTSGIDTRSSPGRYDRCPNPFCYFPSSP